MLKKIETYSQKRKFTSFVHRLIFKPTEKTSPKKRRKQTRNQKSVFEGFDCKIIRNIEIETLDPFSFSVDNPDKVPNKWIDKAGNNLHIKSRKWTIRNYLLFKKNDELDSLLVKESERLIQQLRFVRNVTIKPVAVKGSKDSVDISIRVLDSWSLIPTGSISSSNGTLEITERNFMGLGHEFENNFRQRFTDSENAYGMRYTIPNFKNTFINTSLLYDIDFDNNYTKSAVVNRSFFSPYTRVAGGVQFFERFYRDSLSTDTQPKKSLFNFKYQIADVWAGHSFRIFKGRSEDERITNLVTSVLLANQKYIEKPSEEFDTYRYFTNAKIYLTTLGITSRKFTETNYLFNNGIPEYVQIGKTYAVTGGMMEKNGLKRAYFGGRFSFGGFYRWGYFSSGIEVGSFSNSGRSEQTTIRLEANYFTDLIEVGNWKFRQFVKPQLILGNNRVPIKNDLLNLGETNGIQGFTNTVTGTKKFLMTLQTQSYVPGSWNGFRLSPFFSATMGMLGDDSNQIFSSRLYSKFGIGVMISNDYLVFNRFQVSLAYYPSIPGSGNNLFKTNTFENGDLQLPDFQIGKPTIVPYE